MNLIKNAVFTQEQIAECMDVDQTTVSKWKNGERDISDVQFFKLCAVLGYSMADFLNGNYNKQIMVAFKANQLEKEDILAISKVNKLFANISYMEALESNEIRQ